MRSTSIAKRAGWPVQRRWNTYIRAGVCGTVNRIGVRRTDPVRFFGISKSNIAFISVRRPNAGGLFSTRRPRFRTNVSTAGQCFVGVFGHPESTGKRDERTVGGTKRVRNGAFLMFRSTRDDFPGRSPDTDYAIRRIRITRLDRPGERTSWRR